MSPVFSHPVADDLWEELNQDKHKAFRSERLVLTLKKYLPAICSGRNMNASFKLGSANLALKQFFYGR